MENQQQRQLDQLIYIFNLMFDKDSLRKNVYLFNALSQHMHISLKVIAKERKVAHITNDIPLILAALKQCPYVEVLSHNEVKVLIKGDEVIVKLKGSKNGKITRKEVNSLTRQIKCHYKEERDFFTIEFQSHAAAVEFVERIKTQNKGYDYQLLEKDPYKCLEEAIANHRKQKKNEKAIMVEPQYNPQIYYIQEYISQLASIYPTFVRRAVDSDYEDEKTGGKQEVKVEKTQETVFSAEDFPTFDNLGLSEKAKLK